jgi:hypothetical protein
MDDIKEGDNVEYRHMPGMTFEHKLGSVSQAEGRMFRNYCIQDVAAAERIAAYREVYGITKKEEENMNKLFRTITVYKKDTTEVITEKMRVAENDESAQIEAYREAEKTWDADYITVFVIWVGSLRQGKKG